MKRRSSHTYTPLKALFVTMQRGARWMGFDVRREIELKVHIAHDEVAGVWYVASSDVPGLRLEAPDALALVQRVADCAQELIELNEDEILKTAARTRPFVSLRPVFDSPLQLAHA